MSFFTHFLLPGIIAGLLFLLLSETVCHIRGERVTGIRRLFAAAAALYLAGVFWLTLPFGGGFQPFTDEALNAVPFVHIFLDPPRFIGGLLLFVPLGIFLPLLFMRGRSWFFALKTGAALSAVIELLQLIFIKTADIDDIILNTAGMLLGVFIGRILLVRFPFLRDSAGISQAKNRRKKKKYDGRGVVPLAGLAALCVLLSTVLIPVSQAETEDISARLDVALTAPAEAVNTVTVDTLISPFALLYDPETKTVLYQKDGEAQRAPASTLKMLTALTVLAYCKTQESVTVGDEIQLVAEDASTAGLLTGDTLTVRQLLYALLLPSGNDAAYVLAAYTGRKLLNNTGASAKKAVAAFMNAENKLALELGAVHSYFLDPDGYDTPGQYTTPHDLAVIAAKLIQTPLLKEIVGTYQFSETISSGRTLTVTNTNKLLWQTGSYYLEQANGIKTGTSSGAGGCLVAGAVIGGKQYICVLMGSTDEGRWLDAATLFTSIAD